MTGCAVCLEGAGRDRPRSRVQHPESYTWSIDLSGPHKKGIDQRGRPSYFMVAVYTVPVQDSFPLPEGLQKVAGDEKRRLQPPEGSPLDQDDLLEQFERELEENLARAAAPVDLTGEDENQQVASAEGQAPLQEVDQEQQSGDGKVPAGKKEKEEKDPSKADDLWGILPHRHDSMN